MAVLTASKCGGDRSGIGLEFGREELESLICGLAMDSRQHLVLKVSVEDTGDTG